MSRMRQKRKQRYREQAEAAAAAEAEAGAEAEIETETEADEVDEVETEHEGDGEADSSTSTSTGTEDEEEVDAITPTSLGRLKAIVESLVFASDQPVTVKQLQTLTREKDPKEIQNVLDELEAEYAERGIVLHNVAGGYQFRTHPQNSAWVQQIVAGKPVRLTRAQLEVLAIIAYRQPITRPEIEEIRGVDSGSPIRVLMERNLIRILGKKEEPGRPMLYGTTKEFLEFFNLKELKDLPTLREFHELTEDSMRTVEEKLGPEAVEATVAEAEAETGTETEASSDEPSDSESVA